MENNPLPVESEKAVRHQCCFPDGLIFELIPLLRVTFGVSF